VWPPNGRATIAVAVMVVVVLPFLVFSNDQRVIHLNIYFDVVLNVVVVFVEFVAVTAVDENACMATMFEVRQYLDSAMCITNVRITNYRKANNL
jgi:hypothetical protein